MWKWVCIGAVLIVLTWAVCGAVEDLTRWFGTCLVDTSTII